MDIQENRIAQILADGDVDNEEMQEKTSETIAKYLHYLKKNIEFPCIVTGLEDFSWEEKYIFGHSLSKKNKKILQRRQSILLPGRLRRYPLLLQD
ncbi:MAG: hypothetical protein U5R30_03535 [Deltaproteobacteria bacterium]|nr:hypothetical protein [Deltaproteobacteria bacterium]